MTPAEAEAPPLATTEIVVGSSLIVRFPALNKNPTLFENDKEIADDSQATPCIVRKVLALTGTEESELSRRLLQDNPIWERMGGSESTDPAFAHLKTREDMLALMRDSTAFEAWKRSLVTVVVAVVPALGHHFKPWFVNTEGYDYARYVGR